MFWWKRALVAPERCLFFELKVIEIKSLFDQKHMHACMQEQFTLDFD